MRSTCKHFGAPRFITVLLSRARTRNSPSLKPTDRSLSLSTLLFPSPRILQFRRAFGGFSPVSVSCEQEKKNYRQSAVPDPAGEQFRKTYEEGREEGRAEGITVGRPRALEMSSAYVRRDTRYDAVSFRRRSDRKEPKLHLPGPC